MMSEELINKIDIDDEQIKEYIELYSDFVSEKYFGKFYEKALAFFIAHYITLDNIANNENGALDSSIIAGKVISEKEGDLSRTYAQNNMENESILNKTYYGIRYLDLQKMCKPLGIMRKKP